MPAPKVATSIWGRKMVIYLILKEMSQTGQMNHGLKESVSLYTNKKEQREMILDLDVKIRWKVSFPHWGKVLKDFYKWMYRRANTGFQLKTYFKSGLLEN